jgi:formyltetrahydrofolate-dependent phosphoribosylglycinamide formyltransferase
MIKILLIGGGAREYAIARAIKKSPQTNALFCFASTHNPGIFKLSAQYKTGQLTQLEEIARFAKQHQIDFAIIGPEGPLALGLVDVFLQHGIDCIGPTQKLAQIETSKGFARNLLKRFNVSVSPRNKIFTSLEGTKEFLEALDHNFVVKADGLIGGKGVKIAGEQLHSVDDAVQFCEELLSKQHNIVIEEKLEGQEFSLLSFSDGKHLAHMPPVQDHKRAYENDTGPNTGGMGCYTDANHLLPFLSDDDISLAQQLNQIVITMLAQELRTPYKGILYGGFMRTKDGIKLLEYNARFGDPEAINLLALLETDFIMICQAIISGTLNTFPVQFVHKATVCKYLVPIGYPDHPEPDQKIEITTQNGEESLYYAAVNAKDDQLYTTTSRSIAVLEMADTIAQAEEKVESMMQKVKGSLFHRRDIGKTTSINEKILHMNRLCETNYPLLAQPLKLAVLASGRGSIIPKLMTLLETEKLPVDITLIISNQSNAPVLDLGMSFNIETVFEKSENNISSILKQYKIDLILLIGYMRILSKDFVREWQNKILNVHPSLLPAFGGLMDLDVHCAVLKSGVPDTGCTVHLVDDTVDEGPILVQKRCKVETDDTPEKLKKRVQNLESEAFFEAIQNIYRDRM